MVFKLIAEREMWQVFGLFLRTYVSHTWTYYADCRGLVSSTHGRAARQSSLELDEGKPPCFGVLRGKDTTNTSPPRQAPIGSAGNGLLESNGWRIGPVTHEALN